MSCNFMSSNFTPCYLVRHFHVLHFHALLLGPSFSCPAISCPAILMVRHFHVRHFQSTRRQMSGAGSQQDTSALFHKDSGKPERTAGMWLAPELSANRVHEAMGLCVLTASLSKPNGRPSGRQRLPTDCRHLPCIVIHRLVSPVASPCPVHLQHCSNQHQELVDAAGSGWSTSTVEAKMHYFL